MPHLLFILLISLAVAQLSAITYPKIVKESNGGQVYNGVKVLDPYAWMEKTANASVVQDWVQKQRTLTQNFIQDCPNRNKYIGYLNKYDSFPFYSASRRHGGKYAYKLRDPTNKMNKVSHWILQDGPTSPPRKLEYEEYSVQIAHDASRLAFYNKTAAAIQIFEILPVGERLVDWIPYNTSQFVYLLSELQWDANSTGFYYIERSFMKNERKDILVKYHKVGTSEKTDLLVVNATSPHFCGNVDKCEVSIVSLGYEGDVLILSSGTPNAKQEWIFNYNLVNLSDSFPKKFEVIHIKKTEVGESLSPFFYTDGKLYFKVNRAEFSNHTIMVAELVPNESSSFDVRWRTIFQVEPDRYIWHALGIQGDKMFLQIENKNHRGNNSVQLRSLKDGGLLKELQFFQSQTVSFNWRSDPRDPQIMLDISLGGMLSQIFSFNSSAPDTELAPFLTQEVVPKVRSMTYDSLLNRSSQAVEILQMKDDASPGPAFIILSHEEEARTKVALLHGFNAALILPKELAPSAKDPFFASWLKMRDNITNVIDMAEGLIKEGITTMGQLYLVGGAEYSALVANVVNKRPDLFSGVLLSHTKKNWNPISDVALCQDGGFDSTCTDVNRVLFPLIGPISPLQNVGRNNATYPTIVVNLFHDPFSKDEYASDMFGLQYLAELQHTLGGRREQKKPFLLMVNTKGDSAYGFSGQFTEWADLFCVLEKSSGL